MQLSVTRYLKCDSSDEGHEIQDDGTVVCDNMFFSDEGYEERDMTFLTMDAVLPGDIDAVIPRFSQNNNAV